MKRLILAACAATALGLAAGSAQAQVQIKPADAADLECLAVTLIAGSMVEEGTQEHAGIAGGVMYFLGKLEGRTPGVDWLERLTSHLMTLDQASLETSGPRCGAEMEAKGKALVDWGQRMAALGGQ